MPHITPVARADAEPRTRQLLDGVEKALGTVPNMMATMAVSPALLEGYLALNAALQRGVLDARTREAVALAVAERNACGYCLAAHGYLGSQAGLDAEAIAASRRGAAAEPLRQAALSLAVALVDGRGRLPEGALAHARAQGLSDAGIAEVAGHVALNVLTNYFNLMAATDVDFPALPPAGAAR